MPAAIADLRAGLANNLRTIPGLRVYELIPDNPSFPAAVISLDRVAYDSTMARGADEIAFLVTLVVGRSDDRSAQTRLDTYLAGSGAQSVKTAIEADVTLGGAAMTCRVEEARNIATVDSLLLVDFSVTVYA